MPKKLQVSYIGPVQIQHPELALFKGLGMITIKSIFYEI